MHYKYSLFGFLLLLFTANTGALANGYLLGGRLSAEGKANELGKTEFAGARSIPKLSIVPDIRGFVNDLDALFGRRSFYVKEIVLENNTVLDAFVVSRILQHYKERTVTITEFNQLLLELNDLYLDQAYLYSGVVIPKQTIDDGFIRLLAKESKVSKIEIIGNEKHNTQYLRSLILNSMVTPLQQQTLEESLYSLQQQLRLRHLQMSLYPGIDLGQVQLKANIEEAAPARLYLGIDNLRSTVKMQERLFVHYGYYNFSGWGDSFTAELGVNEKLSDYALSYAVPLLTNTYEFSSYVVVSDEIIIELPVDYSIKNLQSKTYISGIQLQKNISFGSRLKLYPMLGLEYKDNTTRLFDEGLDTLDQSTSTFTTGISFDFNGGERRIFARLANYSGLSNPRIGGREENFFSLVKSNITYTYFFSHDVFRINSTMQYSLTQLPYTQRFVMGGAQRLRAYKDDILASDNGFFINVEYDLNLYSNENYRMLLRPFVGFYSAWDELSEFDSRMSSGLTYQWRQLKKWDTLVTYIFPLQKFKTNNNLFDNASIHFSVSYRVY